jgi:uroporphyrinogen decarboxylase
MSAPELYRRLVRPFHARIWRLVKELGRAPVLLHSCGAVSDFIPDMIESGVDALNPVQVSAAGMEPDVLVRKFGKRMSFWGGGCDTQKVLGRGTPDEVRAEVRRRKAQFKGSGWVFTQVHNIQADVPPENVVAMYDEARRP